VLDEGCEESCEREENRAVGGREELRCRDSLRHGAVQCSNSALDQVDRILTSRLLFLYHGCQLCSTHWRKRYLGWVIRRVTGASEKIQRI
jgi:hypothetical protein